MKRYLFLALIFLVSCQVKKVQKHEFSQETQQKDSIVYIHRDVITIDTQYVQADTATLIAKISDSLGQIYLTKIQEIKTKTVRPRILIKNDTILIECIVDSIRVFNILREKYTSEYKQEEKTEVITETTYTKIVKSQWWPYIMWGLIALVVLFAFKFLKKYFSIF